MCLRFLTTITIVQNRFCSLYRRQEFKCKALDTVCLMQMVYNTCTVFVSGSSSSWFTSVIRSTGNFWTQTACRRVSEPRGERCRRSSHFLWTSKHQVVWKRTPELTSCSWWHNPLSQSSSESGILTETACGETESPMLTPCKSHQTVSLVGNSDIHPCLCIQDPEDAHDANCDVGDWI